LDLYRRLVLKSVLVPRRHEFQFTADSLGSMTGPKWGRP
jgi:hypothetical protein